ncbi:hypothetical protein BYT27DRAFT_7188394 [Phlegmacium glaucopus]|nr:hypothetical protein BYT27DRAFT_7188394 [Phlegmacium glaucopus]
MGQSLVLDAISCFPRLCNYGRAALPFIDEFVDQTNKTHQEAIVESMKSKNCSIFEEMRTFRSPLTT